MSASSPPAASDGHCCGNALHFLTDDEAAAARPRRCAPRSGVRRLWCAWPPAGPMCSSRRPRPWPSGSAHILPEPAQPDHGPRLHPVSADSIPQGHREPAILCPVLFAPYKHMVDRLSELARRRRRVQRSLGPGAGHRYARTKCPRSLASHPRIELLGQLAQHELRTAVGAQPGHLLSHRTSNRSASRSPRHGSAASP